MTVTDRFADLVRGPEDDLARRLDEAGLLIAAHAHEGLDVDAYLTRFDELAASCTAPTLDGVVTHVFGTLGFAGNTEDYHDPRNSYLDDVVDRRLGIPITLAVVAISIARRAGVALEPIGMPGHFLVGQPGDPGTFVDPFEGRMVTEDHCRRRFQELFGPTARWDPHFLDPTPARAVVSRMLANLRSVGLGRGDLGLLEWVVPLRSMIPGAEHEDITGLRHEVMRRRAPLN